MKRFLALALLYLGIVAFAAPAFSADRDMPAETPDGLKLVKRLRADETYQDVPIIIITTEGAEEDRQRALQLGANAYITKPIQAPQVIALVELDEGVRLMSNIVGVEPVPEKLPLGLRLRVGFEPRGSQFLPVFSPEGAPDAAPGPASGAATVIATATATATATEEVAR